MTSLPSPSPEASHVTSCFLMAAKIVYTHTPASAAHTITPASVAPTAARVRLCSLGGRAQEGVRDGCWLLQPTPLEALTAAPPGGAPCVTRGCVILYACRHSCRTVLTSEAAG